MRHSKETIEKMRLKALGKKHTEKTKEKIRLANIKENNPRWRGNEVSYNALHTYIRKYLPKPSKCQECSIETTHLDAANVTGIYERDFSNWKYLCRYCHMISDGRIENLIALRLQRI